MASKQTNTFDPIVELREEIRVLREKKRLSQGDLAKLVGSSQSAISAFEDGKNIPRKKVLSALFLLRDSWKEDLLRTAPAVHDEYFRDHVKKAEGHAPAAASGGIAIPTSERPEQSPFVECQNCGNVVEGPPRCIFCGICSEPLGVECPQCGTLETRPNAKFCFVCGTALVQT